MAKIYQRIPPCCDQVNRKSILNHFLGHCGMESIASISWLGQSHAEWNVMFSHRHNELRRILEQSPIWAHIKADYFFVCPEGWPQGVREAFDLEQIPTPYEVACRFAYDVVFCGILSTCDATAMWWWLAGMPLSTLEDLGFDVEKQVLRTVRALRLIPAFEMWALGTDLTPASEGDPQKAALIMYLQSGATQWSSPLKRVPMSTIYNSPWVQGQLSSRQPLIPIQRCLKYPDYFFKSKEAKKGRYPRSLE